MKAIRKLISGNKPAPDSKEEKHLKHLISSIRPEELPAGHNAGGSIPAAGIELRSVGPQAPRIRSQNPESRILNFIRQENSLIWNINCFSFLLQEHHAEANEQRKAKLFSLAQAWSKLLLPQTNGFTKNPSHRSNSSTAARFFAKLYKTALEMDFLSTLETLLPVHKLDKKAQTAVRAAVELPMAKAAAFEEPTSFEIIKQATQYSALRRLRFATADRGHFTRGAVDPHGRSAFDIIVGRITNERNGISLDQAMSLFYLWTMGFNLPLLKEVEASKCPASPLAAYAGLPVQFSVLILSYILKNMTKYNAVDSLYTEKETRNYNGVLSSHFTPPPTAYNIFYFQYGEQYSEQHGQLLSAETKNSAEKVKALFHKLKANPNGQATEIKVHNKRHCKPTPLEVAFKMNDKKEIDHLLTDKRTDITHYTGIPHLMSAIYYEMPDCIKRLFEINPKIASITFINANVLFFGQEVYTTPVGYAAYQGKLEILKLLVETYNQPVNADSFYAMPPIIAPLLKLIRNNLMLTERFKQSSNFQCLIYLIEKGAETNIAFYHGRRPYSTLELLASLGLEDTQNESKQETKLPFLDLDEPRRKEAVRRQKSVYKSILESKDFLQDYTIQLVSPEEKATKPTKLEKHVLYIEKQDKDNIKCTVLNREEKKVTEIIDIKEIWHKEEKNTLFAFNKKTLMKCAPDILHILSRKDHISPLHAHSIFHIKELRNLVIDYALTNPEAEPSSDNPPGITYGGVRI